jgi:hypothetical protein
MARHIEGTCFSIKPPFDWKALGEAIKFDVDPDRKFDSYESAGLLRLLPTREYFKNFRIGPKFRPK